MRIYNHVSFSLSLFQSFIFSSTCFFNRLVKLQTAKSHMNFSAKQFQFIALWSLQVTRSKIQIFSITWVIKCPH